MHLKEDPTLRLLISLLGVFYFIVTTTLALYGIHNLITTILYLSMKPSKKRKAEGQPFEEWPPVTIQLPIFNEKYTVERLLRAVTRLDYPADRFQIQVLDDSTDDTYDLIAQLVDHYQSRGINIELIHRVNRKGYKAGALENGLRTATGELIAIFDADFVPKPDWLKRTVPSFQNPQLGCLQTRWGHTNQRYNSLTQAEALGIDGHFIIEQTVRSKNGFFLNFNGTAGLWRRACIEDAGGWQWDTLTEDLDLSYRAQMRGWKFDYLPDVVVPAELPPHVGAYKKQQFRWAKGSFQVVRKILPTVLRANLPLGVRFMALLHLTGYFVHPLMLSMLLLTLPVGLLVPGAFSIFPIISLVAGLGPPLLYLTATATQHHSILKRMSCFPLLVIVGFGMSLSTTVAVLEGLFSKGGAFIRTPKLNIGNRPRHKQRVDRGYVAPLSAMVWIEIVLGLYALLTGIVLMPYLGWGILFWMVVYMLGFFYIAGLNLIQHVEPGVSHQPSKSGAAD
jgi:cellulose synthase/poly-beta-1,6-N-acetylglucosamine synthase-like glycosyltransferase